MRLKTVNLLDNKGVVLAKLSTKIKQKKIQGVFDGYKNNTAQILKGKRSYNFKKEFEIYVSANYGDVISKKDKKRLEGLVEEHYEDGCIENVPDLKRHIEVIGKREGILFD
jgi:hypothetical protein